MKPEIIFADLSYINHGKEWTILPMPLNVAYLAAYVNKMLPGSFSIKIIKDPYKLIETIESRSPKVVAFSNYIWNKNLSLQFAAYTKTQHPECITIMGGPNINVIDHEWVKNFTLKHPQIDFLIEGEGEVKMYNLLACSLEHKFQLDEIKNASPVGTIFLDNDSQNVVNNTSFLEATGWSSIDGINLDVKRNRLRDLNDIPSPYLTGLLDEFLKDRKYCPIIETNRGCPYLCTFCNWGDMGKSKSSMFSLDRVFGELKYISETNYSETPYLYIGDANFGLFKRDIEIATVLRNMNDASSFPKNIYLYFAKNSTEKVVEIAEILKDMVGISLSRQTQNEDVLKKIRRSNISVDTFNHLSGLAKKLGVESTVELITGLPDESKESFYKGVRHLLRQNVDRLHIFPAMLLNGSEMGTSEYRNKFGMSGEHRLIDGCAGEYGPVRAMEFEEIVTQTNVMSRSDYFELRIFHFLQTLFLDTRLYKDVVILLENVELIDLILDIIANYRSAPEPFRELIEEFVYRAKTEFYKEIPEEFSSSIVEKEVSKSAKLNPLFISKLLYEANRRSSFNDFVKQRIVALTNTKEQEIDIVLDYIDAQIYPFDNKNEHTRWLKLDAEKFSQRDRTNSDEVELYIDNTPRLYSFLKTETYETYVERYKDLPLYERVYKILLHHTRSSFRATLTHEIQREADIATSLDAQLLQRESGERRIRLEGGWLY